MSERKALIPVKQEEVEFYGDLLIAMRSQEGIGSVPVRPIGDFWGVNFDGQGRRFNRDPLFSDATMFVVIPTTDIDPSGRRIHPPDYIVALKIK